VVKRVILGRQVPEDIVAKRDIVDHMVTRGPQDIGVNRDPPVPAVTRAAQVPQGIVDLKASKAAQDPKDDRDDPVQQAPQAQSDPAASKGPPDPAAKNPASLAPLAVTAVMDPRVPAENEVVTENEVKMAPGDPKGIRALQVPQAPPVPHQTSRGPPDPRAIPTVPRDPQGRQALMAPRGPQVNGAVRDPTDPKVNEVRAVNRDHVVVTVSTVATDVMAPRDPPDPVARVTATQVGTQTMSTSHVPNPWAPATRSDCPRYLIPLTGFL
jgi:hypothetical protein